MPTTRPYPTDPDSYFWQTSPGPLSEIEETHPAGGKVLLLLDAFPNAISHVLLSADIGLEEDQTDPGDYVQPTLWVALGVVVQFASCTGRVTYAAGTPTQSVMGQDVLAITEEGAGPEEPIAVIATDLSGEVEAAKAMITNLKLSVIPIDPRNP